MALKVVTESLQEIIYSCTGVCLTSISYSEDISEIYNPKNYCYLEKNLLHFLFEAIQKD